MSQELVDFIRNYSYEVIAGFESGMYKTIQNDFPEGIIIFKRQSSPVTDIYRGAHEKYFTDTYNSICRRDDEYVNSVFDQFRSLCSHQNRCLVGILGVLISTVHLRLNRSVLDCDTYEAYMASLKAEIERALAQVDIAALFQHECAGSDADVELGDGEKIIEIRTVEQ